MAKIDIEGFRLESDEGAGWKLGKLSTRTRDGEQVEVIRDPTYHAKLEHALSRLRDSLLHESNATTLEALLADAKAFHVLVARAAAGLETELQAQEEDGPTGGEDEG